MCNICSGKKEGTSTAPEKDLELVICSDSVGKWQKSQPSLEKKKKKRIFISLHG